MYCKKCNINVKKEKKVCPKCGMALVPGEVKGNQTSRLRRVVIIASAVALVVVAVFLTIFLIGRVPPELSGTWYETNGYGYVEFKPSGVMIMNAFGYSHEGTYTFNSAKDEGTILYDKEENTFTCDGATMNWKDSELTKTYVEQIQYDWNSMFSGLES